MSHPFTGYILPEEATKIGGVKLPAIYKQVKKGKYNTVKHLIRGQPRTLIVAVDYLNFLATDINEIASVLESKRVAYKKLRGALKL